MVRFHVLNDEVVGRSSTESGIDIFKPFVGKPRVNSVHNGDLIIKNNIRIICHSVRHTILPLEKINFFVGNADVNNIFRNFFHMFMSPF